MIEDRPLERLECRPGLEPELLGQRMARLLVGVERLRLTPRTVERQHLLAAQPLAQRVGRHEPLELGQELGVPAECQARLEPLLQAAQTKLLEPRQLGLGEVGVAEISERRAAPERERPVECREGCFRIVAQARTSLGEQGGKAVGVELARSDSERVTTGFGPEPRSVAQGLPQP